jgi:hypothetical protein
MRPIVAAVAATIIFTALAADAQEKSTPQLPVAMPKDDSNQPGLGEIMALQQMRHIKLWFAGHAANWPLADYEIGELNEGFDAASQLLGGDIVQQHVGVPLAALQKAVDAKDSAAFTTAFDNLSAGCNACHYALDHGFIIIQRPTSLLYSDQSFTAPK